MPFNRVWDGEAEDFVINRDITAPVQTAETGTTTQQDGTIVVANQNNQPQVPPATPVSVTLPGPNERVVLSDGRMNPRWWRFMNELYRRTGGRVDNINKVPSTYLGPITPDSLAFTGYAPTITVTTNVKEFPGTGTITFTGYAPTLA